MTGILLLLIATITNPIPLTHTDDDRGTTPAVALTGSLEDELGQEVWLAGSYEVSGDWAFFMGGAPIAPDGRELDWTPLGIDFERELDNATVALLRREVDAGGEPVWTVVELDLLCNDLCWEPYPDRHPGAPDVLFP